MEAPEKIYLYPSDRVGEEYEDEWGDKPWGEDYIEYTSTDAFIEKACEWLENNASNYIIEHPFSSDVDFEEDKMIEDFKKYMED